MVSKCPSLPTTRGRRAWSLSHHQCQAQKAGLQARWLGWHLCALSSFVFTPHPHPTLLVSFLPRLALAYVDARVTVTGAVIVLGRCPHLCWKLCCAPWGLSAPRSGNEHVWTTEPEARDRPSLRKQPFLNPHTQRPRGRLCGPGPSPRASRCFKCSSDGNKTGNRCRTQGPPLT